MKRRQFKQAVKFIDQAFAALANAPGQGAAAAINASLVDGKIYELRILAWLLGELPGAGRTIRVVNGQHLLLKTRPGRIDRNDPYLEVSYGSGVDFEVWCNVEFVGVGFFKSGHLVPLEPDYHELDIAVTVPDVPEGLLPNYAVLVAIECKDRPLNKGMLRQALGLRRELSVMRAADQNFQLPIGGRPPITTQDPPSLLFLCSSWALPRNYDNMSPVHAIEVLHVAP